MRQEDFQLLYQLEEGYWWFVGMRQITRVLLDRSLVRSDQARILDAGCGTGLMLSWLQSYASGKPVVGIDCAYVALQFCQKRGHRQIMHATVCALPFKTGSFDLITSFDVLCQLADDGSDLAAIREFHRALKPHGVLLVRVPAYEWLRSSHDQELRTFHRYTLSELKRKLIDSGFSVERATYANTLPFPLALLRRLAKKLGWAEQGSDVKPLPRGLGWLNAILAYMLRAEAAILSLDSISLPFGLSAIVLARKL